jgi:RHS repeat-associated protein
MQYVWNPEETNSLVLRDRSTAHNGTLDERLWVQQDANGDVTALVNTSGSVVERYVYNPYGVVTYLTSTWGTLSSSAYAANYLFQGERLDPAVNQYTAEHRVYLPTVQRWVNPDPLAYAPGDVNLYRTEFNNPVNQVDPNGLDPKGVAIHAKFRPSEADILWLFAPTQHDFWDVDGSDGAKKVLGDMEDDSIDLLYLNTHALGALTADLVKDKDYQDLIKSKMKKGGTIYVYSCQQGVEEEHRKQYQAAADRMGVVIYAPTGSSTTPLGGFGIVDEGKWIKYTPGGEVPYKGEGRLPTKSKTK